MEKRNEQLKMLEDVHEMLTDALKLAANEPSVGLYFVQQHVHKAVPTLLNMKQQITNATAGAEVATADVKDSLSCIKSMKDCGLPVVERMIKTLQTASNQIPTNRQSRGSFSQLLPRPVRPPGLNKAPFRSSSFLGDWHSDSSANKGLGERPSTDSRDKDPGGKPALPFSDPKISQKKATYWKQQDASSSAGCENSDASESNDPFDRPEVTSCNNLSDRLKWASGDSHYYMLSLLGAVGREVKLKAKDVENQIVGDGRVSELKDWISGHGLMRFSWKAEGMPENPEGQVHSIEHGLSSEDLVNMKDNFEKFQTERAAKLEAWLSQPADINSSSSSQHK